MISRSVERWTACALSSAARLTSMLALRDTTVAWAWNSGRVTKLGGKLTSVRCFRNAATASRIVATLASTLHRARSTTHTELMEGVMILRIARVGDAGRLGWG